MDKYSQEVGTRVRKARLNKNLSQAQLAEMLELTPPYISNIEMGKQAMSIIVLAKLCDALDVSADWILRSNTRDALSIDTEELSNLLSDCTPAERSAILRMAEELKKTIRSTHE